MSIVVYAVILLGSLLAVAFGWIAMKRQRDRGDAWSSSLQKVYAVFVVVLAGLTAVLLALIHTLNGDVLQYRFGMVSLVVLVLLFAVPILLASLRLEPRARKDLRRSAAILILAPGLPILVYWMMAGRVHPLGVAVGALISAVAAILLLGWGLYRHMKDGLR